MYKKFSIMILALAGVAGMSLVSPVMASLAAEFPSVDPSAITMVVTLPAFTILPALFLTSALVTKVERMWINAIAFLFVTVGGILPGFLHSFPLILVSRGLLGFGMGMLMPMQSTYVAEYPEAERAGIMGGSQGVNNIISALLVMLVGVISVNNWRNAFFLYGIFAAVFLIVFTGIPRTGKLGGGEAAANTVVEKTNGKIGPVFVLFCASQFVVQTFNIAMMSSLSFYVAENGIGGTQLTSTITSVGTLVLAVFSILIPYLLKIFRRWAGVVFLAVTALGFLISSMTSSVTLAVGFCLVYTFAGLYSTHVAITITTILPLHLVALGSSISTASIFIGQFISPMVQKLVGSAAGVSAYSPTVFIVFAAVVAAIMIINLPVFQKKR